ncbi:MAG: aryl-sulfate sulfotransferase [Candidatus Hodarchaeota archaeon]
MNKRKYEVIKLVIGVILIVAVSVGIFTSLFLARYVMFNDGELLPNGEFMICQYEIIRQDDPSQTGREDAIFFVNEQGEITNYIGEPDVQLDQPHEAVLLPNGNILVANCRNDTILEINVTTKTVNWTFDLRELDWSSVDASFTASNYVNNPSGDDWSHVNDVDYINDTGTEYLLISVRNFDMVFEIDYTTSKSRNYTFEGDITWWFGFPGDHTKLNHQHNTDYVDNETILVADSENGRIVEINKSSKTIIWESPESLDLYWVRDVDLNPLDSNILLVTDSLHHRVIEYNRLSSEIIWEYTGKMIQPYQADYNGNNTGQVIISDGVGGRVFIVDKSTNTIIREYQTSHGSYLSMMVIFLLLLVLPVADLIIKAYESHKWPEQRKKKNKKIKFWTNTCISIGLCVFLIWLIFDPQWLMKLLVVIIDNLVRSNQ